MKEHKIERVDVNNDALMVSLGIRPKDLEPRDPLVWTKTIREKNKLKKVRNTVKTPDCRWPVPDKPSRFKHRLTVHIRYQKPKGSKRFKNTYSYTVGPEEIEYILQKYKTENSAVVKAYYNGHQIAV